MVNILVLRNPFNRLSARAHLRHLVGVCVPVQRLLQRLCRRHERAAQGHAAAAGLGAEHGGREEAVLSRGRAGVLYIFTF